MAAASAAAVVVSPEPMPAAAGAAGGVAEAGLPAAPRQQQQRHQHQHQHQPQQHHPHPPPPQQHQHQQQQQQWFVDERDGFISWLRGEFAAANAVIDLLLHHLRTVGEPGEYDHVAAAIHQRRAHWTPVLHMQQYFPVNDVSFALQQASWGRQQQQQQRQLRPAQTQPLLQQQQHRHFDGPPTPAKDGRKPGFGHKHGRTARENHGSGERNGEKAEDKVVHKEEDDVKQRGITQVTQEKGLGSYDAPASKDGYISKGGEVTGNHTSNLVAVGGDENCSQGSPGNCKESVLKECANATLDQEGKDKSIKVPRVFSAMETCDGKKVNVVEGLKLYEDLLNDKEITELILLANKMRASGRKGELQGQTILIWRRPVKGHGREVIQFGIPIIEATSHEDEGMTQSSTERKVEAIPTILHDLLDRLVQTQILAVKPDFCVIDFFNEGDHSQPHIWPPWYGRPVCNLFLTQCDIVYGRVVGVDQKGDYNGSLKVSLNAGALLVMEGKSADSAKRAIPSLRKQRIILTFGKSRLKKDHLLDGLSLSASATPAPGPWVSSSVRAGNFGRHSPGPKHYGVIPTTTVRAAPAIHPNGIQPLFVAAHVAPAALPFSPASVPLPPSTTGWTVPAPARQSAPSLPVPGTGVFIPPGSVHSAPSQQLQVAPNSAETIYAPITNFSSENGGNGVMKSNTNKNVSPGNRGKENAGTSEPKLDTTENLSDDTIADKHDDPSEGSKNLNQLTNVSAN